MNANIEGNQDKLKRLLGIYAKHKGLTIELLLKNGETVVMHPNRRVEPNAVVDMAPRGIERRIFFEEINRADIYTW